MTPESFEKSMRVFEQAHEYRILPQMYVVVRLDGRSFSKLTSRLGFRKPMDPLLRDHMVSTTKHLMSCGFQAVFGYTQSDEISILLHPDFQAFGRKASKINSILAGEGSAHLSLLIGESAVFDCRISQLPNRDLVRDYFRWRIGDALRNGLNAHSYWKLRDSGATAEAATEALIGMNTSEKNELLFQHGINFNEVPAWEKRGTGVIWTNRMKEARNPITGEHVHASRRVLVEDLELPTGDALDRYLLGFIPGGK